MPYYRRQWFFWLFFVVFAPVAIAVLVSGDVYYVRGGEVRGFGMANRAVAGIIASLWAIRLVAALVTTSP